MKPILLLLPLIISTSLFANPELPAGHQEKPRFEKHEMFAFLNLSEQQKQQMQQIHKKYRPQIEALKDDREGKHQLRKQMRLEIRAILTPEQQRKFDEQMGKARQHRKELSRGPNRTTP